MIRLFGFATHDAPGEAEAECALLQQHGIVDAVLSEDVDTIMFGCTKTLRNWTAEGKGSAPTHISMFDVHDRSIQESGLDREGMVLVALMSGGDYLPDGIPGCGIKVACEAAKAGFGKSVCQLKASDQKGIEAWRASLAHELRTNEQGYFRNRHKALTIPEDFPNIEVLRYYTHPAVSQISSLAKIRENMDQHRAVDILGLREFSRETFGWDYRIGAIKFVRVLAPALLVQKLLREDAQSFVKRVSSRRTHFSTDATPELRLTFIPQEVLPSINLDDEVEEVISFGRDGLALNSDDDFESPADPIPGSSQATVKMYDITKPEMAWVLETVSKKAIPDLVQAWEEKGAIRKSPAKKKAVDGKTKKTVMPNGALDRFVSITKPVSATQSQAASKTTQPESQRIQRPHTPTRGPSKQSFATKSPPKPGDYSNSNSLPLTPRTPIASGNPQPILISSSPPDTPPSPSPVSKFRKPPSIEDLGSLRQIAPPASTQGLSNQSSRKGKRQEQFTPQASQTSKLKQTTIDMFASRGRRQDIGGLTEAPHKMNQENKPSQASVATLEINSSPPPQPLSPSKRGQSLAGRSRSPSLPAPKKLLIPRTSAVGFFKEVEVDEDERDEMITRETNRLNSRGVKARIARWSDVSVIDLTNDD